MSTSVQHRRQQQRRGDRTGVAAALATLDDHRVGAPPGHLLGVLGQTDRRNHHHACLFELRDQVGLGRQRERRDLDALTDQQVDALVRVTGVGADVDPERLVGGGLHLRDRGLKFVERHGRRREDAKAAGVRGRRHQPRTRHPAHPGLHDRMLDADQFGQRGAKAGHRISLSRNALGSITSRISFCSSSVGSRVVSASSRPCTSNEVFSATCSASTPGCSDSARI